MSTEHRIDRGSDDIRLASDGWREQLGLPFGPATVAEQPGSWIEQFCLSRLTPWIEAGVFGQSGQVAALRAYAFALPADYILSLPLLLSEESVLARLADYRYSVVDASDQAPPRLAGGRAAARPQVPVVRPSVAAAGFGASPFTRPGTQRFDAEIDTDLPVVDLSLEGPVPWPVMVDVSEQPLLVNRSAAPFEAQAEPGAAAPGRAVWRDPLDAIMGTWREAAQAPETSPLRSGWLGAPIATPEATGGFKPAAPVLSTPDRWTFLASVLPETSQGLPERQPARADRPSGPELRGVGRLDLRQASPLAASASPRAAAAFQGIAGPAASTGPLASAAGPLHAPAGSTAGASDIVSSPYPGPVGMPTLIQTVDPGTGQPVIEAVGADRPAAQSAQGQAVLPGAPVVTPMLSGDGGQVSPLTGAEWPALLVDRGETGQDAGAEPAIETRVVSPTATSATVQVRPATTVSTTPVVTPERAAASPTSPLPGVETAAAKPVVIPERAGQPTATASIAQHSASPVSGLVPGVPTVAEQFIPVTRPTGLEPHLHTSSGEVARVAPQPELPTAGPALAPPDLVMLSVPALEPTVAESIEPTISRPGLTATPVPGLDSTARPAPVIGASAFEPRLEPTAAVTSVAAFADRVVPTAAPLVVPPLSAVSAPEPARPPVVAPLTAPAASAERPVVTRDSSSLDVLGTSLPPVSLAALSGGPTVIPIAPTGAAPGLEAAYSPLGETASDLLRSIQATRRPSVELPAGGDDTTPVARAQTGQTLEPQLSDGWPSLLVAQPGDATDLETLSAEPEQRVGTPRPRVQPQATTAPASRVSTAAVHAEPTLVVRPEPVAVRAETAAISRPGLLEPEAPAAAARSEIVSGSRPLAPSATTAVDPASIWQTTRALTSAPIRHLSAEDMVVGAAPRGDTTVVETVRPIAAGTGAEAIETRAVAERIAAGESLPTQPFAAAGEAFVPVSQPGPFAETGELAVPTPERVRPIASETLQELPSGTMRLLEPQEALEADEAPAASETERRVARPEPGRRTESTATTRPVVAPERPGTPAHPAAAQPVASYLQPEQVAPEAPATLPPSAARAAGLERPSAAERFAAERVSPLTAPFEAPTVAAASFDSGLTDTDRPDAARAGAARPDALRPDVRRPDPVPSETPVVRPLSGSAVGDEAPEAVVPTAATAPQRRWLEAFFDSRRIAVDADAFESIASGASAAAWPLLLQGFTLAGAIARDERPAGAGDAWDVPFEALGRFLRPSVDGGDLAGEIAPDFWPALTVGAPEQRGRAPEARRPTPLATRGQPGPGVPFVPGESPESLEAALSDLPTVSPIGSATLLPPAQLEVFLAAPPPEVAERWALEPLREALETAILLASPAAAARQGATREVLSRSIATIMQRLEPARAAELRQLLDEAGDVAPAATVEALRTFASRAAIASAEAVPAGIRPDLASGAPQTVVRPLLNRRGEVIFAGDVAPELLTGATGAYATADSLARFLWLQSALEGGPGDFQTGLWEELPSRDGQRAQASEARAAQGPVAATIRPAGPAPEPSDLGALPVAGARTADLEHAPTVVVPELRPAPGVPVERGGTWTSPGTLPAVAASGTSRTGAQPSGGGVLASALERMVQQVDRSWGSSEAPSGTALPRSSGVPQSEMAQLAPTWIFRPEGIPGDEDLSFEVVVRPGRPETPASATFAPERHLLRSAWRDDTAAVRGSTGAPADSRSPARAEASAEASMVAVRDALARTWGVQLPGMSAGADRHPLMQTLLSAEPIRREATGQAAEMYMAPQAPSPEAPPPKQEEARAEIDPRGMEQVVSELRWRMRLRERWEAELE